MSDVEEDDYKRTIYVGNLPDSVTENDLYAFFNTFG
jgi:RNA recognition motif-containing protein